MALVIHRDYSGEHDIYNVECWCNPLVVDENDHRTIEEVIAASRPMPC